MYMDGSDIAPALGPLRPFNVKPGKRSGGVLPDANPVFDERTDRVVQTKS